MAKKDLVSVTFIKSDMMYGRGMVAGFPAEKAADLVKHKFAVYTNAEDAPAEPVEAPSAAPAKQAEVASDVPEYQFVDGVKVNIPDDWEGDGTHHAVRLGIAAKLIGKRPASDKEAVDIINAYLKEKKA